MDDSYTNKNAASGSQLTSNIPVDYFAETADAAQQIVESELDGTVRKPVALEHSDNVLHTNTLHTHHHAEIGIEEQVRTELAVMQTDREINQTETRNVDDDEQTLRLFDQFRNMTTRLRSAGWRLPASLSAQLSLNLLQAYLQSKGTHVSGLENVAVSLGPNVVPGIIEGSERGPKGALSNGVAGGMFGVTINKLAQGQNEIVNIALNFSDIPLLKLGRGFVSRMRTKSQTSKENPKKADPTTH